ncbi:histone-like nucleoid-structuring protein Lsr2 [Actinomadura sp. 21ATH]|uniref:Lsr2 family DNA-binding protein n=1 Tax=Actinomadura sp. 21ATH TaxID=1735444 RepID=UPI0035BF2EC4
MSTRDPGRPGPDEPDEAESEQRGHERTAAIRAWAKQQGLAVTDDGPLPAAIVAMYEAAH